MSLLKKIREEKDRARAQQQQRVKDESSSAADDVNVAGSHGTPAPVLEGGHRTDITPLPGNIIAAPPTTTFSSKQDRLDASKSPFVYTGDYPFLFDAGLIQERLAERRVAPEYDEVYFIPEAITPDFETFLMQATQGSSWRELSTRDVQLWGRGLPPTSSATDMREPHEEAPAWLDSCLEYFSALTGLGDAKGGVNHVLVNRYYPGQGVPHHTDGPRYANCAAILSLGAPIALSFRKRHEAGDITYENSKEDIFQVLLEPRSVLMFRGDLYDNHMHGIEARFSDAIDSSFKNIENGRYDDGFEVSIDCDLK